MKRAAYNLGVDLGGTNMVVAVVDARGRVGLRSKIPTLKEQGPAKVLARMAAEILKVAKDSGLPRAAFGAVGVGSPGPLNAPRGLVQNSPNLPGFKNIPLVKIIQKKTGFRTFLENDANCAALAEAAYGAGKGKDQVIMLTLGTGVGGGIILGGELYSGPDTTAGELGHFAIDPRGPRCNCGQRGCLEQYASATAMARRARQLLLKKKSGPLWRLCGGDLSKVTSKLTHDALQQGDAVAKQVWKETSWALGSAMAGYINIFNPDMIILFGGVMLGGKELLRDSTRVARAGAFKEPLRRVRIVRAKLGDDAGVIGAAEVARRALAHGRA